MGGERHQGAAAIGAAKRGKGANKSKPIATLNAKFEI